jgi:hypothetical protein
MLKRLTTLFLVVAFAGPIMAGGYACASDGERGSAKEMACCKQAESPSGPAVAKMCCEMVCGESTGGTPITPSGAAPQPQAPALHIEVPNIAAVDLLPTVDLSARSANDSLLYHSPPDLYLHNSAFLI